MFELVDNSPQHAVIKVIGVGGGGGNAVQHMVDKQIDGVDFICANTDAQALQRMNSGTLLQLGNDVTKGLGAGANQREESKQQSRTRSCCENPLKARTWCSSRLVWVAVLEPARLPSLRKSLASLEF